MVSAPLDFGAEAPRSPRPTLHNATTPVELLLSSQTNRMKVAQYLLPEDPAALKARLAQITAAYEELHAGVAGSLPAGQQG